MARKTAKVILDTNIIISAVGFGGKPREIIQLVLDKKIRAVTSPILMAELDDVVAKRFPKLTIDFTLLKKTMGRKLKLVNPSISLQIVKDDDDNRVLEAAVEGECQYIVTGDKQLLELSSFQGIKILTADQFLREVKED